MSLVPSRAFSSRSSASLLRGCLVAALLAMPAAVTHAETQMVKTITYFPIGGNTAEELDKALSAHGPLMKSTGARHPGATKIKFGGTVSYVSQDNRCSVGTAKVTLATRLILPRWTRRAHADKDLGLVWDTLSADIKRHEERHAEIARNYARDLERALTGLPPRADCAAMQADVAKATATVVEAHDKAQADFDRREAINFDRRMIRLLKYRLEQIREDEPK
ncbi:peptidase [Rhizobium rhizosphaerae]|uniref:Peptidase n=1 Tax=Xaviernesmea rhizosphaerae TaxID=1672749 RepID=A0ABX3PJN0_9HYPH|nr:peptidase [Xaviernesmea rhizosphaerae]